MGADRPDWPNLKEPHHRPEHEISEPHDYPCGISLDIPDFSERLGFLPFDNYCAIRLVIQMLDVANKKLVDMEKELKKLDEMKATLDKLESAHLEKTTSN